VWFYPTISATITGTYTKRLYSTPADVYSIYDESACVVSEETTTESRTFYMETRSGLIWPASPYGSLVFPGYAYASTDFWGGSTAALWPALSPPVLQRQIDGSVFACSTYGEPVIDDTNNVDATQPWKGSPLRYFPPVPFGLGNNFGEDRPVGVGYDPMKTKALDPRQSSGYPWGDYPYGGPGIPVSSTQCKLDLEEYDDQIYATSTDRVGLDGAIFRCNPFFDWDTTVLTGGTNYRDLWHFEHTAFSQVFRSIVNAP